MNSYVFSLGKIPVATPGDQSGYRLPDEGFCELESSPIYKHISGHYLYTDFYTCLSTTYVLEIGLTKWLLERFSPLQVDNHSCCYCSMFVSRLQANVFCGY